MPESPGNGYVVDFYGTYGPRCACNTLPACRLPSPQNRLPTPIGGGNRPMAQNLLAGVVLLNFRQIGYLRALAVAGGVRCARRAP